MSRSMLLVLPLAVAACANPLHQQIAGGSMVAAGLTMLPPYVVMASTRQDRSSNDALIKAIQAGGIAGVVSSAVMTVTGFVLLVSAGKAQEKQKRKSDDALRVQIATMRTQLHRAQQERERLRGTVDTLIRIRAIPPTSQPAPAHLRDSAGE